MLFLFLVLSKLIFLLFSRLCDIFLFPCSSSSCQFWFAKIDYFMFKNVYHLIVSWLNKVSELMHWFKQADSEQSADSIKEEEIVKSTKTSPTDAFPSLRAGFEQQQQHEAPPHKARVTFSGTCPVCSIGLLFGCLHSMVL